MEEVEIKVTRENVEDYLRASFFKPTPEVVTAILQAIKKAYQDGELPDIIEPCLYSDEVCPMLENL